MSEHDPIKAQQQLERATDFAHDINMPTGYLRQQDTKHLTPDYDAREVQRVIFTSHGAVSVKYDAFIDKRLPQQSQDSVVTNVDVPAEPGTYHAEIGSGYGEEGLIYTTASVQRDEKTHHFERKNADQVAALITSLAAKRLGESATRHADSVIERTTAARDTFHSEQN